MDDWGQWRKTCFLIVLRATRRKGFCGLNITTGDSGLGITLPRTNIVYPLKTPLKRTAVFVGQLLEGSMLLGSQSD